jgi:membrane-associated phospholipid phosphatase
LKSKWWIMLDSAWRLYRLNYGALACMGLLLGICLTASRFSVQLEHELVEVVLIVMGCTIAGHCLTLHSLGLRPAFVLISIAQLILISVLGAPLTYIAASANLPLQDAMLARWDQLLGLDWISYYKFIIDRPALTQYAILFYAMITWPMIGVPVFLGMTGNYVRLQQFTMACILTVCVTTVVSTLVPAIGTYHQYNLPADTADFKAMGYLIQLERLPLAREGVLRTLNFSQIGGIVTFPSFHASAAILALWGLWGVWWLRPLALITNIGMLLATPLLGGHYFVDVIAGVALAAFAIAVAKWISTRAARAPSSSRKFGMELPSPSHVS